MGLGRKLRKIVGLLRDRWGYNDHAPAIPQALEEQMAIEIKGWLKLSESPKQFVVVGRLYHLTQHFLPKIRSSAACMAPRECTLCQAGIPTYNLSALPVKEVETGLLWLLKLHSSQHSLGQRLASKGPSLIGTLVTIEQSSPDNPNRALMHFGNRIPQNEIPVENYIKAIGRRAYAKAAEYFAQATPEELENTILEAKC